MDYVGFEDEVRHFSACVKNFLSSSFIDTKEKSIDIANTLYRIRKRWNMKFDGGDND